MAFMNEQKPPHGIEWTRIPNPDGTVRRGYTLNFGKGCTRRCAWKMSDGKTAICYAKRTALKFQGPKFYPDGFEAIHYDDSALLAPASAKEPAGIFVGSMTDNFGEFNTVFRVDQLMKMCERYPEHIFQFLTKSPRRMLQYATQYGVPPNAWLGVSTPPDFMDGKQLSIEEKLSTLILSFYALEQLAGKARVRFVSATLSWDISRYLSLGFDYDWLILEAPSTDRHADKPDVRAVESILKAADRDGIPVFFKGNMRAVAAETGWRRDFPKWWTVS